MCAAKIVLVKYNDDTKPLDLEKKKLHEEEVKKEAAKGEPVKPAEESKGRAEEEQEFSILTSGFRRSTSSRSDSAPEEKKDEKKEKTPHEKRPQQKVSQEKIRRTQPVPTAKVSFPALDKLRTLVERKPDALSQLMEMFQSLIDVIPDEGTRYTAALRAVQKSYNITAEHILTAVDQRLAMVEAEGSRANDIYERTLRDIEKLAIQLVENDQKVEILKKQIAQLLADKKEVTGIIAKKKSDADRMIKEARRAVEVLRNEIKNEKNELKKKLK